MLAEGYGVPSDDSYDNDDSAAAPGPHSPPNGLSHALPKGRAASSLAAPSSDPCPSSTLSTLLSTEIPSTTLPLPLHHQRTPVLNSNRICPQFDLLMYPLPVSADPGVLTDCYRRILGTVIGLISFILWDSAHITGKCSRFPRFPTTQ